MEIKHEKMYTSDGTLYIPIKIEKPSDAMIVLHHTILRHTADMFKAMTSAIAERYKIDEDDILNTIVEHPNFKNFVEHPILTDLGDYFQDSEPTEPTPTRKVLIKKKIKEVPVVVVDEKPLVEPPVVDGKPLVEPPVKKKLDLSKVKIKQKVVAT
jgi:hypothetical protein